MISIPERTFVFGKKVVLMVMNLPKSTAGNAIANQLMRSGTSVGANIEEAQNASTKKEFIRGMTIALKEARESSYWLRMIASVGLIKKTEIVNLNNDCLEIIKILISSIKKAKKRL